MFSHCPMFKEIQQRSIFILTLVSGNDEGMLHTTMSKGFTLKSVGGYFFPFFVSTHIDLTLPSAICVLEK